MSRIAYVNGEYLPHGQAERKVEELRMHGGQAGSEGTACHRIAGGERRRLQVEEQHEVATGAHAILDDRCVNVGVAALDGP